MNGRHATDEARNQSGSHAAVSSRFPWWLAGLALCALLVAVCARYVDRPIADFFEVHFRQTEGWQWLSHALDLFPLLVATALACLFLAGLWILSGRRLAAWSFVPIECSWATMWALGTERVLKSVFGRPGPDPLYLHHQRYGFEWFHENVRWDSFPSGTALVCAAIGAVIWMLAPKLRWLMLLLFLPLLCAVIVANWHWLSDVIAGTYLGATIGWMTVKLMPAAAGRQGHR